MQGQAQLGFKLTGTLTADYTPAGFTKSVEQLIRERAEARARNDYAEADRIRTELDAAGIVLEDGSGGTTWRKR